MPVPRRVLVLVLGLIVSAMAGDVSGAEPPQKVRKPVPASPRQMPPLPPAVIDNTLAISGEDIDARKINTRMTVEVLVNGRGPYRFLVDSGADTSVVTVRRSPPISSVAGVKVDLGLVGSPINNGTPHLLTDLLACGYLPVVACVGATRRGELLNVNADTLASHLAAELKARRLVIAGGTSGVLDDSGHTIDRLTGTAAARLVRAGTASKGMVAKLDACRAALRKGVGDVLIANGRDISYEKLADASGPLPGCTWIVR